MYITLIVLFLSAIFFMSGKVRSDLVALCALVLLIIFGILTPEEALTGFSNSVVIMMIGLFVVGGAIFQTGLAKMISSRILKLAGDSELKLFILIVLVTAFIGAFVSNTGTVALMLPIVVSMAMGTQINVSRLLMPLAFASSMGGMMTLIGTPPNLVIQEALTSAGYAPLTFFSFTPVGLVCVAVGLVILIPLSKIFLTKKGDKDRKGKKNNDYAADDLKTERCTYVTGIHLDSVETAAAEFMEVKQLEGMLGGRVCYHGYQSFREDEVDADTAHKIGVALATVLWGDRFQVVVATHCNTNHYHNHFVLNSVSDVDGLKFYNSPADYRRMRP